MLSSKPLRLLVAAATTLPFLAVVPARAETAGVPSPSQLATPAPGQAYQFVQWRDRQLGGRWTQGNDDWRWRNRGYRHNGWDRGEYRRYGYRHHRGGDYGGAIAGGVVGLAAGAILGSALANRGGGYSSGAVESCSARFRSYDPRSGTYMGYDGRRHACP